MESFAKRIAELKDNAGYTTETLSQASGVPKGTINKILNGETVAPSAITLKKLATALGTTLDGLCDVNIQAAQISPDMHIMEPLMLSQDEAALLAQYRMLDDEGKQYIRQSLKMAQKTTGK